ncbi:hypothetical protein PSENEW3_00004920 [Picochlorum sp. SENEW3]|nr:hypothetical protein PSENEW3_00004920 [Picochlorum sp. SENEW3]
MSPERGGEESREEVTPNSKIETRNPPRTPYKPRKKSLRSSDGSVRSASKSLAPLFSAAAKRAQVLGGRFGMISKRSKRRMDALEKKKCTDTRGKDTGVEKRRKREADEEENCSHITVHTAPQNKERRTMKYTHTDE